MNGFDAFSRGNPLFLCERVTLQLLHIWKPWPTIENYFKLLKKVLDEHALFENPAQIYNTDELSIPLDHRPPHVLVKRASEKYATTPLATKSKLQLFGT